jgi:hypothetical protein
MGASTFMLLMGYVVGKAKHCKNKESLRTLLFLLQLALTASAVAGFGDNFTYAVFVHHPKEL